MSDAPLLDAATAEFIADSAGSIAVAARGADLAPSLAKGAGCKVSADRRRVTVFVDQQLAAAVVRDLRAGSPIAITVSTPATHRTVQLKGVTVEVGAVTPADREFVRQHLESTVAQIVPLGYPEAGVRAYFQSSPEHLVALTFVPSQAFEQTPGPGAGAPLMPT